MSNREDIKRGLKLSNEGFDSTSSSYVLTLMNTIIKPVTGSYYLSLYCTGFQLMVTGGVIQMLPFLL